MTETVEKILMALCEYITKIGDLNVDLKRIPEYVLLGAGVAGGLTLIIVKIIKACKKDKNTDTSKENKITLEVLETLAELAELLDAKNIKNNKEYATSTSNDYLTQPAPDNSAPVKEPEAEVPSGPHMPADILAAENDFVNYDKIDDTDPEQVKVYEAADEVVDEAVDEVVVKKAMSLLEKIAKQDTLGGSK